MAGYARIGRDVLGFQVRLVPEQRGSEPEKEELGKKAQGKRQDASYVLFTSSVCSYESWLSKDENKIIKDIPLFGTTRDFTCEELDGFFSELFSMDIWFTSERLGSIALLDREVDTSKAIIVDKRQGYFQSKMRFSVRFSKNNGKFFLLDMFDSETACSARLVFNLDVLYIMGSLLPRKVDRMVALASKFRLMDKNGGCSYKSSLRDLIVVDPRVYYVAIARHCLNLIPHPFHHPHSFHS